MTANLVVCDHCNKQFDALEAFPAKADGGGCACLKCFVEHVDSKRTDAERWDVMMGTFKGKAVAG